MIGNYKCNLTRFELKNVFNINDVELVVNKDIEILIWNNNYKFLEKYFKFFPNISLFINWGTDDSNIPNVEIFNKKNIKLKKNDNYSTNAVSEFIVWKSLELLRKKNPAEELFGKNVGIIGMGKIGQKTAEIFSKGFECKVKYFSRTRKKILFEFISLKKILAESDIIIIALKTTNFIINDIYLEENDRMPIIINVSRDFILPSIKLFNLLQKNIISNFLSDNFIEDESLEIFYSNHIAYKTKQSQINKYNELTKILKKI